MNTAPPPAIAAVVYDAYGTLFDVAAPVRAAAAGLGPHRVTALAAMWRTRQLEYTWLRSLMGHYADFWQVTCEALDFALAAEGIDDAALRARLLALYQTLEAYPEASAALDAVRATGRRTAILSNGAPAMLSAAVGSAGFGARLDTVLSVDGLRIYKPHPSVYQLACEALQLPADNIAFVSANGWDAAGATAFGFRTFWLNRTGQPGERLSVTPRHEVASLREVADILAGEPIAGD